MHMSTETELTARGRVVPRPHDRRPGHGRCGDGRLGTRKRVEERERPSTRLPFVVYALALGTFLMGTTEFVVAGLLPEIAGELDVSVAEAGLMITVFAVGMILGAPLMTMLTLRLPRRLTL